jgi:hypothetical protein
MSLEDNTGEATKKPTIAFKSMFPGIVVASAPAEDFMTAKFLKIAREARSRRR